MQFKFDKIGAIDSGSLTLGDLTILCGQNSTGKTYLSYSVYGLLNWIRSGRILGTTAVGDYTDELLTKGVVNIDLKSHIGDVPKQLAFNSNIFSSQLDEYFSTRDIFKESKISMDVENIINDKIFEITYTGSGYLLKAIRNSNILSISLNSNVEKAKISETIDFIINIAISSSIPEPFIVTSERTGIALFYKELDLSKSTILNILSDNKIENPQRFLHKIRSRYAKPIQDNIDTIRASSELMKSKSVFVSKKNEHVLKHLKNIVGGSYKYSAEQVNFEQKKENKRTKVSVPVYVASSSVKSLFLLDLYINCLAKPNDLLIIDEPELNLHPDKQILMARLLASLANNGVKVLITTHSEYILNEISNLIALNNNIKDKAKTMQRNGITEHDIIKPEKVKSYLCKEHSIESMKIDENGIDTNHFIEIAMKARELAEDIYYNID